MSQETLRTKLIAPNGFVALYGTTPPRAETAPDRIAIAMERLAGRVAQLPLDGLVVYDVQDETARTAEPRPFPFLPTLDSRAYAKSLHAQTGRETIVYKCVAPVPQAQWSTWLDESHQAYAVEALSLVGKAAGNGRDNGLSLSQATRMAAEHPARFVLGGVVIAERHENGADEVQRILHKTENGCRYFISQAVYDAGTTIRLLTDYARVCAREGRTPARIVLTFVPCGREKTMAFMRWLGIKIPPQTAQAILDAPVPAQKSMEICRDNLRAILDQPYVEQLPLGINVESVSIYKDEIGASVDLFHMLQEVVQSELNAG